MKVVLFAFSLLLSASVFAQRPTLNAENPIQLSKNFNNGNFIIDYWVGEQAAVNLYLKNDSSENAIYLFKMKAIPEGQYELEVNKSLLKIGTNFAVLEWNGKISEASYQIKEKGASDEELYEKE